jgi:phosphoglycolate phosphatase-like HAD superfamily hydrolase
MVRPLLGRRGWKNRQGDDMEGFPHPVLSRRTLSAALAAILVPITLACAGVAAQAPGMLIALVLAVCADPTRVSAADDPLPSWNDGAAKQEIVAFVRATTDAASPTFVPPEARIATFDQDGTLWVEHPMYAQVVYCLERVPAVVEKKPELKNVEPFKTVLSGDRAAMAKLSMKDLEEILAAFEAEAKKWLAAAKDPRWKRPYTELTYLPMQEVLQYLRANGYKTYIATGGGQDFVRVYAEEVYGIPPEQVVGTAGATKYAYDKDGKPFLTKEPKLLLNDNNAGKPEGIHFMIGPSPTRHSATRLATSRCWSTRGRVTALASPCSCCTTTRRANTPMGLPMGCRTAR